MVKIEATVKVILWWDEKYQDAAHRHQYNISLCRLDIVNPAQTTEYYAGYQTYAEAWLKALELVTRRTEVQNIFKKVFLRVPNHSKMYLDNRVPVEQRIPRSNS